MQLTWISLTLSRHSSLSSIAPGRSSSRHPVSIQSCCRYVLLGHPTLACPCEGVHKRMSLMISFLLLQQCYTCHVCLTGLVLEIGGWWPYNYWFVWCCFQNLFNDWFVYVYICKYLCMYIHLYTLFFFLKSYNVWKHVRYSLLISCQPGW